MATIPASAIGRTAILCAVLLQAVGKVAYGTLLQAFPAPLFVFISFLFTAGVFLALSGRGAAGWPWRPLVVLNVATAVTFLCFFYALKVIEPAIVGAVEIGVGPPLALALAWAASGVRPGWLRLAVCAGILVGCAVLAFGAVQGSGFAGMGGQAWLGLAASVAAGAGAVMITIASKQLLERGWQFGAVLAHRFYLILPLSLALSFLDGVPAVDWSSGLVLSVLAVALVGVLAPLYLLQVGLGRCDPYTLMVTMAALPVLTFLFEGFSPRYDWSWTTAIGLAIVTAFLLLDIVRGRH